MPDIVMTYILSREIPIAGIDYEHEEVSDHSGVVRRRSDCRYISFHSLDVLLVRDRSH